MKIRYLIHIMITVFILAGCYAMQGHVRVRYVSHSENDPGCTIKISTPIKVSMKIPDNYKLIGLSSTSSFEKQYWYGDGSVIYITDEFHSNITYKFIEDMGKLGERTFLCDTMTLSGKDGDGRYWKDIKICQFCVGYSNVTAEKKELYEQSLKSITVNKKSGLNQYIPR